MAKRRGVVASAFKSTPSAISRYIPGRRAEAKAEATIDNLLTVLGEARVALQALSRARRAAAGEQRGGRSAAAKRGAATRKARKMASRQRAKTRKKTRL